MNGLLPKHLSNTSKILIKVQKNYKYFLSIYLNITQPKKSDYIKGNNNMQIG